MPGLRLPRTFAPTSYAAHLAIDPAKPTFAGEIAIAAELTEPTSTIWLHAKQLAISKASVDRHDVKFEQVGDELLALRGNFARGAVHVAIAYTGALQDNQTGAYLSTYGADKYVVSDFEPTSARTVFPCVDDPSVKVPWQLTIDVPAGMTAVSNVPGDGGRFDQTPPLPSYLIAFGVGPWEYVDAGKSKGGAPLRVVVPRGYAAQAKTLAADLPRMVDFLEGWTGTRLPYPKLDILARDSPGGMENAGLITVDTARVLYPSPSAQQRHVMVSLIGHEVAHMWFGDAVTAAWWDDLWLNESFATFMEDKVQNAVEPSWHDEDYRVSRRLLALRADGLANARAVRQPIERADDIDSAFDEITYNKGGSVLGMIEAQLGEDRFRELVRGYLAAHPNGTATLEDVVKILGEPAGAELRMFVDRGGAPELSVKCTGGIATLDQHPYGGGEHRWPVPVCLASERGKTCVDLLGPIEVPLGKTCPQWLLPDAGAHAYARVFLDEGQAIALRDHAWLSLSWAERRAVFDAVLLEAIDGRAPVALAMSFVPKLLAGGRRAIGDALGDPSELGLASGLPIELRALVPSDLVPAAKAYVRAQLAPLAKRLGIFAKRGESLDDDLARTNVLRARAWAGDPVLIAKALELVGHYRELPDALRDLVVRIAVDASPQVADKIRADARAEEDPTKRRALFGALGAISDPVRLTAMLETALSLKERDALALLHNWSGPADRAAVEAWIRAHWSELAKVMPSSAGELWAPLLLLVDAFAGCDAALRDDEVAFVEAHFNTLPGGPRGVAQAIEANDKCIARRAVVEPSIRAWLSRTGPGPSR